MVGLVMMIIMVVIVLIMLVLTGIMPLFVVDDVLMFRDAFEVRLELALALTFRQRTELHVDVTARHTRILIHVPHGQQVGLDLFGQQVTQLLMRHLTATELQLDPHLVTFRQEVFRVRDLDQVIMRIDADAEFHFLHLAAFLMLVGLLLVLLLDVLVLAVIDNLAHWRVRVRSHFHQVQPTLFGDANGLRSREDAKLMLTIFLDHTHLRRTDALIDAGLIHETAIRAVPSTGTVATTTGTKRTTGPLVTSRRAGRS